MISKCDLGQKIESLYPRNGRLLIHVRSIRSWVLPVAGFIVGKLGNLCTVPLLVKIYLTEFRWLRHAT